VVRPFQYISRQEEDLRTDDASRIAFQVLGSAFYISPELFQRTYNEKTDVWSAGVCLYVIIPCQ
jgi:serine/threonine protein kinase